MCLLLPSCGWTSSYQNTHCTLGDEVLLKLAEELQIKQVVSSQSLLSNHRLHGLDVLTDSIACVLQTHKCRHTQAHKMNWGGSVARQIWAQDAPFNQSEPGSYKAVWSSLMPPFSSWSRLSFWIIHSSVPARWVVKVRTDRLRTSWLETSAWSLRVIPSPMADFISRERDGSTLMGG